MIQCFLLHYTAPSDEQISGMADSCVALLSEEKELCSNERQILRDRCEKLTSAKVQLNDFLEGREYEWDE